MSDGAQADERGSDPTIDRRKLLAGGAIAAGAVWALPIVTDTIPIAAAAGTSVFSSSTPGVYPNVSIPSGGFQCHP